MPSAVDVADAGAQLVRAVHHQGGVPLKGPAAVRLAHRVADEAVAAGGGRARRPSVEARPVAGGRRRVDGVVVRRDGDEADGAGQHARLRAG